jgi:hypothetical protein
LRSYDSPFVGLWASALCAPMLLAGLFVPLAVVGTLILALLALGIEPSPWRRAGYAVTAVFTLLVMSGVLPTYQGLFQEWTALHDSPQTHAQSGQVEKEVR